jgi:glycopeptide antibiotics resistance protein
VLPLLAGFTSAEGWRENLPNLIANPVLYAPLGLGLTWRFGLRVRWVVLIAACLSAGVEVSQALSDQMRTPDINDVLLNTAGAALGAWAFQLAFRRTSGPDPQAALRSETLQRGGSSRSRP